MPTNSAVKEIAASRITPPYSATAVLASSPPFAEEVGDDRGRERDQHRPQQQVQVEYEDDAVDAYRGSKMR